MEEGYDNMLQAVVTVPQAWEVVLVGLQIEQNIGESNW